MTPTSLGATLTTVGVHHYQALAALLFGAGLLAVATRREATAAVAGTGVMVAAALLSLAAHARYSAASAGAALEGPVLAMLGVAAFVAQAALAFALVRRRRRLARGS